MRDGGRGCGGAKSCDDGKYWSSVNHLILFGLNPEVGMGKEKSVQRLFKEIVKILQYFINSETKKNLKSKIVCRGDTGPITR